MKNIIDRRSQASVGVLIGIVALLLAAGVVWFLGSENPETPAGYIGYLTQGAVFGQSHFVGLQTGPTSYGRTWMMRVMNVSITPYTYDEEFNDAAPVLAKDNLKVTFSVHLIWKVNSSMIKDFVEKYTTLNQAGNAPDDLVKVAYNNFLQQPLRNFARQEVEVYKGLEIKDNIKGIGEEISKNLDKLTASTPFEVSSVVVGNIQVPTNVANSVANKIAATQDLERYGTIVDIEKKKKEQRIVEAEGIAEAMHIVNQRLTSAYLSWAAIEAQKDVIGSPNHTVIYIPVGPLGIPLVGTVDTKAGTQPEPASQQPKLEDEPKK